MWRQLDIGPDDFADLAQQLLAVQEKGSPD